MKLIPLFIFSFLMPFVASTQEFGHINGKVTDSNGNPIEFVNISPLKINGFGTTTNENGEYHIKIPSDIQLKVVFSHVGFLDFSQKIQLSESEVLELNVVLNKKVKQYGEFVIEDEFQRTVPMQRLNPKIVSVLPTTGHFESILNAELGVVKNNELSSQYSVRGGNFDENLVYVNGIQVYRPFLIRSGRQEGLSFVNADMVESVSFSPGGFEARFGDKMSSVLDITYRKPKEFNGTVMASLLGGNIHIEDASEDYRFTQIHGVRYFTNQYLLGSLDTQGDYQPAFTDYQGYFTYSVSPELELSLLTNISKNKYLFVPETRQSDFGNINQALRLTVYFDGKEIDEYQTAFGAFAVKYTPKFNVIHEAYISAFNTNESETFDLLGAYRLDELNRSLGSEEFGNVAFSRGVGAWLNHARNYLTATVAAIGYNGTTYKNGAKIRWGLTSRIESIKDELKEYTLIDSAGYSIPIQPMNQIVLHESFKAYNELLSNRTMGYFQKDISRELKDSSDLTLSIGGRFNHWTYNNETVFSPRAILSWKPNIKKDFLFRASWGYYYQPPFYREFRNLYGEVNPNIKSQKSTHYVTGMDYNFQAWGRPFKFITEIYYKRYENLIPFEIDNVRIRYYATNNAEGYATGIDMKLNGEIVKGVDSWASISVMSTKEDIKDDFYVDYYNASGDLIIPGYTYDAIAVDSVISYPGYVPRPTDQRVNFGLFFQDYIPKNPSYKMHLNLLYGTGLPTGPPSFDRYKDTLRIPPYRRVDIGFSKQILEEGKELSENNPFRFCKSIWISLEVFNLLQVNNTISYLWVKDVTGRQFGIPNYLTNRRINFKTVIKF